MVCIGCFDFQIGSLYVYPPVCSCLSQTVCLLACTVLVQFVHVHLSGMTAGLSVLSLFLSVTPSLRQSFASVCQSVFFLFFPSFPCLLFSLSFFFSICSSSDLLFVSLSVFSCRLSFCLSVCLAVYPPACLPACLPA